jgi:hypothetical protein
MSTSLLYHALGIRDYGRTDHFASNEGGLAASTTRGSVARVRIWPSFTPFRPCCDRSMAWKKGFTGRTRKRYDRGFTFRRVECVRRFLL